MVTRSYWAASRQLMAQGREEMERGDTRQASEKGWGAAAQMVKDISERRGWEHRSHASLFTAVGRLVDETGDDELRRLFAVASSLHVNFYENWDNAQNVAAGLNDVQRFLDKLDILR